MMAMAIYGTDKFGLSENHGLMPWQDHEEMHDLLGTYRVSGLLPTAGTYAIQTATDAANTPGFDVGIIKDEDLRTTIPACTQGAYTTLRLSGSGATATFDKTATLMTRVGTNYPKKNTIVAGAWTETELATGDIFNVYQLLIPVTSDVGSQPYRCVIVQPQRTFASVAAAEAEDPRSVNIGTLATLAPETVFFTRFTFRCNSSYGSTGKCRIESITYVTGSRASQVSVSGVTPLNHNDLSGRDTVSAHPLGAIAPGGIGYIPFGDTTGHATDAGFKYVSSVLYAPSATVANLSGTGSRMVVANADGLLSTAVLPWRGSNLASSPTDPVDGQFYSDTSNYVYVYANTAWRVLNGPPLFD